MTGNTREFDGIVTGARAEDAVRDISDNIVSATILNTIMLRAGWRWGDSFDVTLTDDLSDAGDLVGRRVRVTVEVLDA